MTYIKRLSTVIAFSSLVFLSACGNNETNETNETPVEQTQPILYEDSNETDMGGDLVWVSTADAISFDPHRVNDIPSMVFQAQVFQGLLSFDESGNIIPVLAIDFRQIYENIWEFDLRQNVYFHDGTPFNADAVVINFSRILDPNPTFPIPAANIKDMITNVEAIDNYTVHITTAFPFAPLLGHLTPMGSFIISPSSIHAELEGISYVNENPIGTGPFVFHSRVHGDYTTFIPNQYYWGGVPYVDTLTIRVIPDAATRLAMLETGETNGFTGTAIDVPSVRGMENANYITIPSAATEYIGFNLTRGPLENQMVRQAISYAINRQELITIMEDLALPAISMAGPTIAFSPSGLEVVEQDLDRARELLAQTPYADGFSINIWYNTGSTIRSNISELVQFYLAQIGITANITGLEWSTYQSSINALEHDMFILNWVATTGDTDRAFHPLFYSGNIGSLGNRFGYSNPLVDDLILQGRQATNPADRYVIYEDIAAILAYDLPLIPLWHIITPYFYNGIEGLQIDFRSIPYFARVRITN